MGSLLNETKPLQVRLSRKVVREFMDHDVLPDSNDVMQPVRSDKIIHDSKIRDSKGMQPVILLDRISADEMKKHSGQQRSPVAAKTAAPTATATEMAAEAPAADNAISEPPSKMTRQQKSPEKVSNAKEDVSSSTRSTRSKAAPVSLESTRTLRNKHA